MYHKSKPESSPWASFYANNQDILDILYPDTMMLAQPQRALLVPKWGYTYRNWSIKTKVRTKLQYHWRSTFSQKLIYYACMSSIMHNQDIKLAAPFMITKVPAKFQPQRRVPFLAKWISWTKLISCAHISLIMHNPDTILSS